VQLPFAACRAPLSGVGLSKSGGGVHHGERLCADSESVKEKMPSGTRFASGYISVTLEDSMTTIDGFTLSISGSELIGMCEDKVQGLKQRIEQLKESLVRVKEMAPEDREIAGFKTGGGDMADEVRKKLKAAEQDLRYFTFASEHLEPEATYRLGRDDLRVFRIQPVYR
jgi:hypothetical protein